MKDELLFHFNTQLSQLKKEINAYPDEASLWLVEAGISNSAGNLCYHLVGNLMHFMGTVLAQTNYIRNRPLEFSIKDVPRSQLTRMIDETIIIVKQSLEKIEDFNHPYPEGNFDKKGMNIKFALLKLITHLNYHLGQINYHRRLLFPDS